MNKSEKFLPLFEFIYSITVILGVVSIACAFFYRDGYSEYKDSEVVSYVSQIGTRLNPVLKRDKKEIRYHVDIYSRKGKFLATTLTSILPKVGEKNEIKYFLFYPRIHVSKATTPLKAHFFLALPLIFTAFLSYLFASFLKKRITSNKAVGGIPTSSAGSLPPL